MRESQKSNDLRARTRAASTCEQSRVYILPTRYGIAYLVFLFFLFVLANAFEGDIGFALVFFLASFYLVGLVHTHYNLAGLEVSEVKAAGGFAHEPIAVEIRLKNPSRWRRGGLIVAVPGEAVSVDRTEISERSEGKILVTFQAAKRGRHELPRFKIFSVHPVGLFRAWLWVSPAGTYAAYPAPAGSKAWSEAGLNFGDGAAGAKKKRGGEDFHGLRVYQAGDSLKHVHWRAHAKGYPVMTKVFAGEAGGEVAFTWDDVAHLTDIEAKLSQLSLWIIIAKDKRLTFTLKIPGTVIAAAPAAENYHRALEALADYPGGT